jgi:hypothetical protein
MSEASVTHIDWRTDLPPAEWDAHVARVGGHPLQSALWGDARKRVDRIRDHRWLALAEGKPVLLARIEMRTVAKLGRVAWIPRGPVGAGEGAGVAFDALLQRLRKMRILVCVDNPDDGAMPRPAQGIPVPPPATTVRLGLHAGRDRLWAALDSQWRYGVGRAARQGVVVEQSRAPGDVGEFWGLCERLSRRKGFRLPGSEALAQSIVRAPPADTVEARLFLARCEGRIGAGAIVIRCGPSLHYFWGATNRDYSRMRCGEALHWGVIEWGLGQRLETYDLEGVDPAGNDATYRFKMKMGGEVVALPVRRAYPLNALGWIAIAAARALGKL